MRKFLVAMALAIAALLIPANVLALDCRNLSRPASIQGLSIQFSIPETDQSGNVVAYNAATGQEIWKTYVIDEEPVRTKKNSKGTQNWGPAGAGVWTLTDDGTVPISRIRLTSRSAQPPVRPATASRSRTPAAP